MYHKDPNNKNRNIYIYIYISTETENLLRRRREVRKQTHVSYDEVAELTRTIKKAPKRDKRNHILKTVSKELDVRDRWAGIRALKKDYNPTPYNRKDKQGKIVAQKDRAETAAKFLAENQWGKTATVNTVKFNNVDIVRQRRNNTRDFLAARPMTLEDVEHAVDKLKRHKAPGPDQTPIELFKELTYTNKTKLVDMMNEWWDTESIPEEALLARVVLIYKKGGHESLRKL